MTVLELERRPQALVALDEIVECGCQRVGIEGAGQPYRIWDAVGSTVGLELMQEEHSCLRRRLWDRSVPLDRHDLRGGMYRSGMTGRLVDPLDEARDRRVVEDRSYRQLEAEGSPDPRGDLGGEETVAPQVEEVIVHIDMPTAEDVGPDDGQRARERRLGVALVGRVGCRSLSGTPSWRGLPAGLQVGLHVLHYRRDSGSMKRMSSLSTGVEREFLRHGPGIAVERKDDTAEGSNDVRVWAEHSCGDHADPTLNSRRRSPR